jgi:hypothetical protein
VRASREKGLGAIAIPDQNDLCVVKYVRNTAQDERDTDGKKVATKDQIIVFPGIEPTLNVLCQALLFFEADLPDDLFSLVLTALAITPSAPSESRTITALGL